MANKAHRTTEQCRLKKKKSLSSTFIFPSARIHLSPLQLLFIHLIRMIKNLKKAHLSLSSLLYCVMLFETSEREKKRGLTCLWPKVSPLHHLISKHFTSTCETRLYYKNDGNYQKLQCPRCSFRVCFCWTDMTAKWFEGVFKMKIFELKVNMLIFTPSGS